MRKMLLITAMFMATSVWSIEIKLLEKVETETGNFYIYCIDRYKYITGGPGTTPTLMMLLRGPSAIPATCRMPKD